MLTLERQTHGENSSQPLYTNSSTSQKSSLGDMEMCAGISNLFSLNCKFMMDVVLSTLMYIYFSFAFLFMVRNNYRKLKSKLFQTFYG